MCSPWQRVCSGSLDRARREREPAGRGPVDGPSCSVRVWPCRRRAAAAAGKRHGCANITAAVNNQENVAISWSHGDFYWAGALPVRVWLTESGKWVSVLAKALLKQWEGECFKTSVWLAEEPWLRSLEAQMQKVAAACSPAAQGQFWCWLDPRRISVQAEVQLRPDSLVDLAWLVPEWWLTGSASLKRFSCEESARLKQFQDLNVWSGSASGCC